MSLLARLAPHVGGFQETIGTEGLGLLLADHDASRTFVRSLQTAFPELPNSLRFITQAAAEETRPDVVGLDVDREVIHVEGKFWAGLTESQANNLYLKRLAAHHQKHAPEHACRGILVWVCPPQRSDHLWADVMERTGARELTSGDIWRFARTPTDQGMALIDWIALCEMLEHSGSRELAEDARQLTGFVREVDENTFLPWTVAQVTDQEAARRRVELINVTHAVREVGVRTGALDRPPGRNSYSALTYAAGPVIYPGGVGAGLLVASDLQAKYGRGPWYLRWWGENAAIARQALRGLDILELGDGCALPVPLRVGALRDELVTETVEWLREISMKLARVRAERLGSDAPVDDGPSAEDGEPDTPGAELP